MRCDDGYEYAITDVSRWDANAFADGPLGELPTPTCDWSLLDQPTMPAMEVRHYTINGEEYLFIRNLYETRRMLCTLYNAIGANEQTWQGSTPVLRKDGTQLVRMELSIPKGSNPQAFWPWKPERSPRCSIPALRGLTRWRPGMYTRMACFKKPNII